MNEYEMNQMDLVALEVRYLEIVRDRQTDKLYIRCKLADGSILMAQVIQPSDFVTASAIFFR